MAYQRICPRVFRPAWKYKGPSDVLFLFLGVELVNLYPRHLTEEGHLLESAASWTSDESDIPIATFGLLQKKKAKKIVVFATFGRFGDFRFAKGIPKQRVYQWRGYTSSEGTPMGSDPMG